MMKDNDNHRLRVAQVALLCVVSLTLAFNVLLIFPLPPHQLPHGSSPNEVHTTPVSAPERKEKEKEKNILKSKVTGNSNDFDDGWKSIHVFVGNSTHLEQKHAANDREWFSQAHQDEIVAALFRGKTGGYFIDLAANDAVEISNTYGLEKQLDWHGLCIEANPAYWHDLSHRKNCQVIGAVVGRNRMEEVSFRFQGGTLGGIVREDLDNKQMKNGEEAVSEYTVPLEEILQRFNAPDQIDYLSLDVEGAETYILTSFPLDRYAIQVMTVERPKQTLKMYLWEHGFHHVRTLTWFNETLWVHTSAMGRLDMHALERFGNGLPQPQVPNVEVK